MRLEAGQVFSGYTVESRLGRGGMATVYLVRESGLNRRVALKVLPEHLVDDAEFALRFEQEAQVIAGLDHPNIIPLYRFGITDDVPWMALRYVDGGDLAARLTARPLAVPEGLAILRAIASALDYAHKRGVIHRDLKPQNVLLSSDGAPYLADFGVAKLLEGTGRMKTATGGVLGTPAYMSPEQAMGHKLGPYTDVYALAIICFQWLTGSLPFDADTPHAILMKHVTEPVPAGMLTSLAPNVAAVLERGLAKAPEQRTASASALIAELEHALFAPATTVAPPVADSMERVPLARAAADALALVTPVPQPKPVQRGKLIAVLGAVALALVAGGLVWRSHVPEPAASTTPSASDAQRALAGAPSKPKALAETVAQPATPQPADADTTDTADESPPEATADEVIAKSIEAHGGVARWKALRSARAEGYSYLANGVVLTVAGQTKRPGKTLVTSTAPGFLLVQGYDGKRGWYSSNVAGKQTSGRMSAGQTKEIAYQADLEGPLLDYRKKGSTVTYLGEDRINEIDVLGLQVVHRNGDTDTIFVDADTYLLKRMVRRHTVDGVPSEVEIDFDDYREVDGYTVSFAQEYRTRGRPQDSFKVVESRFEPNVDIPDSVFEYPGR